MAEPTYAKFHYLRMCADRIVHIANRWTADQSIDKFEHQVRVSMQSLAEMRGLGPDDIEELAADLMRLSIWKNRLSRPMTARTPSWRDVALQALDQLNETCECEQGCECSLCQTIEDIERLRDAGGIL